MIKRFLIVNSSNIKRSSFIVNDSLYTCTDSILLSDIFTKYEIPKEYQKVFFYKSLLDDNMKEFLTDVPFNIRNTTNGSMMAIFKKRDNPEKLDFYAYTVDSNKVKCSKEYVMNFYLTLYDKGYLKKYLTALNEYFILNMDVDYIFELSEGNESLSKQKKLYKKRMLEKNN